MNRIQKLCILICVFSPFAIYGGYARGANIEDVILLWGLFVTSFVGIFLFREKQMPLIQVRQAECSRTSQSARTDSR